MERVLLLFDKDNPFWTPELVALAGEDPGELECLFTKGLLELTPCGNYCLSDHGKNVLLDYAYKCGVPLFLPEARANEDDAVWATRFRLLFDNSFVGRWSLKEYRQNVSLSFFPGLSRRETWAKNSQEGLKWVYPDHPMVRSFKERYPDTGMCARRKGLPDSKKASHWCAAQGLPEGRLFVPVLFLSRYDFPHYSAFSPLPQDQWEFLNADRMFCFRAPVPSEESIPVCVDKIAGIHLFLQYYRRVHLPGYTHFDAENQENLNWIVWVTDSDDEAESLLPLLKQLGPSLADFELPLDIRVLSLETLQNVRNPYETVYGLLFHESPKAVSADTMLE